MKKLLFTMMLLLVAASVLIPACKKKDDTSSSIALSPTSKTLTSNGGVFTISVTASDTWTATSNQTWCELIKSSGTAHDSIMVFCTGNTGSQSRTATITVSCGNASPATFVVTENAAYSYICSGIAGNNSYFPLVMGNKWVYGWNYYVSYSGRDTMKINSNATYNGVIYFKTYQYNPQDQSYNNRYFRLDNATKNVYEYYNGAESILVPGTPTVGQDLGAGYGCASNISYSDRKVSSISASATTSACTYSNCLAIDNYSNGSYIDTEYYVKGLGFIMDTDFYLMGADLH
jgi:hypothetical protein